MEPILGPSHAVEVDGRDGACQPRMSGRIAIGRAGGAQPEAGNALTGGGGTSGFVGSLSKLTSGCMREGAIGRAVGTDALTGGGTT